MKYKNILVTGGHGMVGKALQKIIPEAIFLSSRDCDLRNAENTEKVLMSYKPDAIIHLAAQVGGVKANSDYVADFFTNNILINTNVLTAAKKANVKKVLSIISTCVYPDKVNYPLTEGQIHNGPPHESNFGYAYTKRMLDVQSRAYRKQYGCNFITAASNNLFGEYDNFDLENSHVIPAMIRKFYEAEKNHNKVVLWGDGAPLREFTYSEDLAKILLFLLEKYDEPEPINIGNTQESSIKEVAEIIAEIINFKGEIIWDKTKPSGQYRKPSDNSKLLKLGWKDDEYVSVREALKKTCEWFKINYPNVRGVNKPKNA